MLKVVQDTEGSNENAAGASLLDEIVRDGARAMLAAALQAEAAAYVDTHRGEVDEAGHRLVVRNGHHAARKVTTAADAVPVRAPRVNDKRTDETTGERKRFSSAILPAWSRKSPQVAEVLPLLYLQRLVPLGLRSGVGAVPRLGRWSVRGDDHPTHDTVARRRVHVQPAFIEGHRLRLLLGRWDPPQGPPGTGQGMSAGDPRCPRRWDQGAGCAGRRVPRIVRVVGRPAPLVQAPRYAGPGAGGRRRCAWVLEGDPRGVSRDQGTTLLVALCRPLDYADVVADSLAGQGFCA